MPTATTWAPSHPTTPPESSLQFLRAFARMYHAGDDVEQVRQAARARCEA